MWGDYGLGENLLKDVHSYVWRDYGLGENLVKDVNNYVLKGTVQNITSK